MPNFQSEINRKRLIKKARILGILYAERLSNKSLLKIVNTHNTDKKLIRIFNELGKRTVFTNSEIDKLTCTCFFNHIISSMTSGDPIHKDDHV